MALFRTGLYVKNHSVEKVQVAKTPIASYNGNVTGLYIPELIAYITAKQSGSGTPSPNNIRPISGVSECNVVRCGKNVWSYGDVSGTQRVAVTVDIKAGTYTVSANVTSSDTDFDYNLMLFYYEDRTTESVYIDRGTRQSETFTLSKNVTGINFYASRGNNVSVGDTFSFTDIQLEVGSTATAYEVYQENTYTIQLGDTYYGCILNATTGELTVTDARDKLKNLSWIYQSANTRFCTNSIANDMVAPSTNYDMPDILCECYTPHSLTGANSGNIYCGTSGNLFVMDSNYTDTTNWLATVGDYYFRYKLKTPITVQLTPMQIEQLLGTNNVWADTGDVEVKFYNVVR